MKISLIIIAAAQARIGIERLHQQDVAATLSGKADDPAALWDNDAVRIQSGRLAEVSKAVIDADDKRWEAKAGGATLCHESSSDSRTVPGSSHG